MNLMSPPKILFSRINNSLHLHGVRRMDGAMAHDEWLVFAFLYIFRTSRVHHSHSDRNDERIKINECTSSSGIDDKKNHIKHAECRVSHWTDRQSQFRMCHLLRFNSILFFFSTSLQFVARFRSDRQSPGE